MKCTHPSCGKDATEILMWTPGAAMVMDGGVSVAPRCADHPAQDYQDQIARADPEAEFTRFIRSNGAVISPGLYTVSKKA